MRHWLTSISALVGKDLLRQLRAPMGTVLILLFPLMFSALMAVSFGGSDNSVPKVRLLIEDRDGDLVGNLIRAGFTSEHASQYFAVEIVEDEGRTLLKKNKASALLRLPKNLTQDLLNRQPTTLELVKNPAEKILPEIAEQITMVLAEVLGSAAYVLNEPLDELQPFLDDDAEAIPDSTIARMAIAVNQVARRAGPYAFPPVIELETVDLQKEDESSDSENHSAPSQPASSPTASIFLTIFPGIAVFALFTLGDHVMRDLLKEKDLGTLRRQFFGPISTGRLIMAKVITTALIATVSLLILSSIVAWVAERGVSIPAFLALSLALVLAVTGSASVICGFATDERQATTIGSVVYLVMAFSSGSFIPLGGLPASVRAIAPFSPFYWATEGFKTLILREGTLPEVALNVGILVGLGAALLFLGSVLLNRTVKKGALA